MNTRKTDRPSLLIVDMVKEIFDEEENLPITPLAKRIVGPINHLIKAFRKNGWPIVFATDAFKRDDFIFTGRMKPYAIEGTRGAEVADVLNRDEEDLWLPKPRFSAFHRTGLDQWLQERHVNLCAVAGITTAFCVLTTALDAVCCDFRAVILEDCTAAAPPRIHEQTLDIYRRSALYPLLRVAGSGRLLDEWTGKP